MKSLSKKIYLLFVISIFIINCGTTDNEFEPDAFTAKAQIYVDRILAENNTKEYSVGILTTGIDGGMSGTRPIGYVLKIKVNRMLVLTNSIDSLRLYGIYRKNLCDYYGAGGGMAELPLTGISAICDTLDSIRIVTDSVIVMPALSVGSTNLTHLPPEIGKVRVRTLDISYNYPALKSLPVELMQLSEVPRYWDTLIVKYDIGAVKSMTTLSDSLKSWLEKHAAKW